jgi:hypothetical protein
MCHTSAVDVFVVVLLMPLAFLGLLAVLAIAAIIDEWPHLWLAAVIVAAPLAVTAMTIWRLRLRRG